MRKFSYLVSAFCAASGLCGSTAYAVVHYTDDFENQTIPLSPPPVGSYNFSGTAGNPFSLESSPALDTTSLKMIRDAENNPTINILSAPGAWGDGKVLEFSLYNYIATLPEHGGQAANAPLQVQLGISTGLVGRWVFLGINDFAGAGNAGMYFYTDVFGNQVNTGVKASGDSWDKLRAVLSLSIDPNFPEYMTGTMDLFLTLDTENGGVEQQLTNDLQLGYGEIPTVDDPNSEVDDTAGHVLMKLQKGPVTGATFFDNLMIRDFVTRLPGDANNDLKVDTLDFNILAENFGGPSGQTFDTGDFSGDGLVTSTDFDIFVANYGQSNAAPPLATGMGVVPEPASLSAALIASTLLLHRRRTV